ncbi:MucR family transcriptional regulator [Umezawaea endophytica]|uniref:MucR family transcriptional regulator n=1 Tax=Umezawaea endophytica TaxID=1654476 RepID=A0A9X2VFI5_9PSEU|nr:MucR family transcriptional regulator [Umezawaea endophytica]MCS7475512.1 MucR family transcriptional regulator [Umezawaea endophytica]
MTLADHAPIGSVVHDGDRVLCHLCGHWFRSVLAHLRAHGVDEPAYRREFGLERNAPLEGETTRRLRADSLRRRRASDPVVRAWCEEGQERARSGALTEAAARAARGRRHPEQRRAKTLRALAAISPEARNAAIRRRAFDRLRMAAAEVAAELGFPDIGALVTDRVLAGRSLAAISREAGLHKDWLSRHLATVAPDTAVAIASRARVLRLDAPWLPVLADLGFATVPEYLRDRHLGRARSVQAIAAETGLSRTSVRTALTRHGLTPVSHAAARRGLRDRADAVATRFGFADVTEYLADRRAAGLSWKAIAAECGQSQSWVRRRAGLIR